MLKKMVIVLALCFSQLSYADCEKLLGRLNTIIGYPNSDASNGQSFGDCRTWPDDPKVSIVVSADFQRGSGFGIPESPGMGLYDLTILLVSTDTGAVLKRLFQKGALSSDSIQLHGISIDLAPYFLSKNTRAFGLKIRYFFLSSQSSEQYEYVNLYAKHNGKLKQVLGRFIISTINHENSNACFQYAFEQRKIIAIGQSSTNGFNDLLIKETTTISESNQVKNECIGTTNKSKKSYSLHFDGDSYDVP